MCMTRTALPSWPRRRQTLSPCARVPHSPSTSQPCQMTSESACFWTVLSQGRTRVSHKTKVFVKNQQDLMAPRKNTEYFLFCTLLDCLGLYALFSHLPPLLKNPKGDESGLLSLRLSGRPEERVRQESSECRYLLFVCCVFAVSLSPEVVVSPASQDLKCLSFDLR